jgi:radical SAM protein with 4Fe4S-binding SPASM domain
LIRHLNIDPNGVCNAKCWFCPVAYEGNSKENKGNMSLEVMEGILKQIDDGRGDFVDPNHIIVNNPIHFNETLLYPHFEEMLALHRKYNIKIRLFSNGVALTPDKTDIVKQYSDVVIQVLLNVPSIEKKEWAKFTGFNPGIFDKLLNNLKYADAALASIYSPSNFYIMINGINEKSLLENGGWISVLEKAPKYDTNLQTGTIAKTANDMRVLFPNTGVVERPNLSDRTNVLSELKVISNQAAIENRHEGKVIGCGYKYPDEHLYVSATGNVFLCCADFNYETVFANIKDKTIKEIWNSQERQEMIRGSYEGICTTCLRAVWEDGKTPALGHG